ncbi:MAG: NUDIX domain-containing protein [Candidatus Eisenbacteria bacterium]|uniref:NUDIX domain-containing protein n=1 Tax=Eiseniibacteriota bacterium TaxID=2212470 RepID=A0A538UC05_UNCEI|nr:MAG: NUDIX domain-containing protein [Candidatus Eisenbacteria bacterium]
MKARAAAGDARRGTGASSGRRTARRPTGGFPCVVCGTPVRRTPRGKPRRLWCPRCLYRIYDYPRITAGMIVLKERAVLLLRRAHPPRRGYLDLPGGFVDAGEWTEDAARRELREETGLTVGPIRFLGRYWDRYFIRGFGFFPIIGFYYLARWRRGVPRAGDDAASAEWVPIGRLGRTGARLAWKHMAEVFRDVRRAVR